MSEKNYKIKCEIMFKKNTILLNQQKIDAEQIRALQKQNGELTDKVKELEAQIEKMKCCNNCKYRCYMDWKSKCCFDMTEIRDIENPVTCKCKKWELAD